MNSLLCKLLFYQLQSIGFFSEPVTTPAASMRGAGVIGTYGRWLKESLNLLKENGYIAYDGYTVTLLTDQRRTAAQSGMSGMPINACFPMGSLRKLNWPRRR